jgi:hypothetical protein
MECYTSGKRKSALQPHHQATDAIVLTTETAPNLNITKRIEIVTAECAFGMNIFKDLFAGVRDIVVVVQRPYRRPLGTLARLSSTNSRKKPTRSELMPLLVLI